MSVIILRARAEQTAEQRKECEVFTRNYESHTAHTQEEVHRYLECNPLKDVTYVAWVSVVLFGLLFLLYWVWRNKK
jgi:hypothetical protein